MNIYDSLKLAARKGWNIQFYPEEKEVHVLHDEDTFEIGAWQKENGLVTPVTALIRAIHALKLQTEKTDPPSREATADSSTRGATRE